jgi:hypothetical protein
MGLAMSSRNPKNSRRNSRSRNLKSNTGFTLVSFLLLLFAAILVVIVLFCGWVLLTYQNQKPALSPRETTLQSNEGTIAPPALHAPESASTVKILPPSLPAAPPLPITIVPNPATAVAPVIAQAPQPVRAKPSVAASATSASQLQPPKTQSKPSTALAPPPSRPVNIDATSRTSPPSAALTPTPMPASAPASASAPLEQPQSNVVPNELATVRASLQKNDLRSARAALKRALAADPNNKEALRLRQELVPQEQARDEALQAARDCAAEEQWQCAWTNAGKALAMDSGNAEARALVQRSIVGSGAVDQPAGPGPDLPDGPREEQEPLNAPQ